MSKNLKLFTDDTSRQTYEQSQQYLEPYVGGVSSAQTSSYNIRNVGKYFIDYKRSELRLSDFDINKDIIEVEYLETQGNCYIITSCVPSGNNIAISTKFMFEGYTSSDNYIPWYSAYVDDSTQTFRIVRRSSQICVQNGSVGIKPNNDAVYDPVTGDIYEIETNRRSVSVNSSVKTTRDLSSVLNTNPLIIFSNNFKGRCYYFKVFDNENLILDLIPVRVGNVGYMYDKISRALFGNSGTCDFVIAKDTYDAKIEYLRSTGTQYIDTWYVPNANTQLYIEFSISKFHSNMANATDPFGVRVNWQQQQYALFCPVNRTNSEYFCYGNLSPSYTKQINLNQKYICNVNKNVWTLTSNGTTIASNTFATSEANNLPNLHLWLFNLNNNNTVTDGDDILNIYKCTIKENNVLIHDFIPVRVGNTGYMYDKISGRLFGNNGSGEFELGEDLIDRDSDKYIEWIKSLGCICYLPMRNEGDLQDRITGKSLQLTGNGSLVWDSSVNKYKVTTSNTVFQYVAWLDNGMNSNTFTNNCFTTLTTFEKITTSGYYANCHLSPITNYSNTAASMSPCYGGTGNVTNYPAIVKASGYVSPTERIYSQQGEIYLTTTPYNDYTASNWQLTGNGLAIGNIRDNNNEYKNKSYYLSEVYVFTTKLNISVIRKIQGYDLYGYNIYDKKIEYLEATGTQWIDTGVYFDTTKHGYEVDGILINDVSGTVTICGTWEGTWDTNHINTAMCGNFNNGYFYTPPTNFRGGTRTGSLASLNVRNKVGFINHGVSNGTITVTRTVNGVSTEVSMTNPYIGVAVDTFPIFGVKVKGTNSIAELAHFKLYGFKMFEHDTVILDLIPVRVGNTGYMYDKISGRLFGNSGTGEFTLGPDVV